MVNLPSALVLVALSLIAWVWFFRRDRFSLPSSWVAALCTLIYMVPSLFFAEEIADMSPHAVTALAYGAVFVIGEMLPALLSRPMPIVLARQGWSGGGAVVSRALRWTLSILGLITVWYLANVPLQSTGLYGVLFDPANAAQLREDSLKLLDSPGLQYVYLIGFSALSPFAFALLLARAGELAGARRWRLLVTVVAFLAFYLLLTGARVGLVNLALAGVMYGLLQRGMRMSWRSVIAAAVILLAVPMLLSFLREQGRNEATVLEYAEAIGERVFLLPLLIAGWFVEYADTHGQVGLLGAIGLGEKVNWSNLIALEFLDRKEAVTVETVTTPTAFIFSNYLYFGWLGLLPSWLGMRLVDMPAKWARRARSNLRLPLLATMLFFSVIYVQSGFGVATVSHGYFVLAAVAWWAAHGASLRRVRAEAGAQPGAARA